MSFALGKKAYGICDICGQRYRLNQLKKQWDGLKVCPQDYSPKHPQLQPRPQPADPEALRDPRPDPRTGDQGFDKGIVRVLGTDMRATNDIVGSPFSLDEATTALGSVTITDNPLTATGQSATASLGTITVSGAITDTVAVSGISATSALGTVSVTAASSVTTYTITVVGGNPSNHPYHNFGSSNKYAVDGSTATADVTLYLTEGQTYRFDQSDSSNSGHPLRFSTTANGTHSGGSEYTTGVTTVGTPGSSGAYTEITVASGAPTLYYYCTNHSGMGWTAYTIDATYAVTVVGGNPSNHPYYNVGSTNKFAIGGSTATADVTLSLSEGGTYRFDQSDSSNSGHPLRFSTTANGTHGGGSEYTTGVLTNGTPGSSGAYTQITVASGAPTLYYYCTNHSAMGWTANTP